MIEVMLNGDPREVPENLTVASLLDYLGFSSHPLLVEHNHVALLRSEWPTSAIQNSDQIELIRVVAGG